MKDEAEDVDLQRDLNEDNSRFDEKSDAFAHKDENEDKDDKDAVAMDVIMAEEEDGDNESSEGGENIAEFGKPGE